MTETYILDSIEVKKTGRSAKKPLNSGKIDNMVEVTPINEFDGRWKKWVRDAELYLVEGSNDTES
jgi:hypothetical protein